MSAITKDAEVLREAITPPPVPHRAHGSGVRGADLPHRSDQFEGRFGRLFRTLPPAHFDEPSLLALGDKMTAAADPPTPETESDDEENSGISAGYTYLGQFIDHDLTFDPASSLQKQNDPEALTDFRTPRFDLDNIYGRGPDDQPYLYEDDGLHFLLGRPLTGSAFDPAGTRDLPRNTPKAGDPQRALIGDPRNDENVIVSQLQGIFLRFHNRVVDYLTRTEGQAPDFERAQQIVRWHYQWVVLHDFLPTIIGQDAVDVLLPHRQAKKSVHDVPPNLKLFKPKNNSFIPIEFTTAAYRFGHSMVRPIYRLNTTLPDRFAIFATDPNSSLVGFRAFPDVWAVDWTLFFPIEARPALGPTRVQPAYKIDTSLVNPLGHLPPSVVSGIPSLAARNLIRGWRMGLPSGQAVARQLGLPVIPDAKLQVGKATEADTPTNPKLTDISPLFKDNAPLWYYLLAEAQQEFVNNGTPIRLGPVGGRIVGEVFVGLLWEDSHSYLRQDPTWQPFAAFQQNGTFGIAELIRIAVNGA